MGLTEPSYLAFSKKIFRENNVDYDVVLSSLEEKEKNKLKRCLHFYYFICRPDEEDIQEELVMVGIISLIEAMMQKIEYKGVFEYFESKCPGKNEIADFREFKREYLMEHGATRKVREYLGNYFSQNDKNILLSGIETLNKSTTFFRNASSNFVPLEDTKEIADFLYKMRSEFVHKAEMRNLNLPDTPYAYMIVGEKPFKIFLKIKEFMKIFEKSFVEYWEKESKANAQEK